jgi:hypothetical protein
MTGERRVDIVDHRPLRCPGSSCRTHDDLNDIDRRAGATVQLDPEVAGELVENHAAAVERLQHEDLSNGRLRLTWRRSKEQQGQ